MSTQSLYELPKSALIIPLLSGETIDLSDYQGRYLLLVNTASRCGFTPQLQDLETLYQQVNQQKKNTLMIVGFPCNQFLFQEPSVDGARQCLLNFGVSFPVTHKIKVNGFKAHPVWNFLKSQQKGAVGLGTIAWNFTKFLIDEHGIVVARFSPKTTPMSIEKYIFIKNGL